MTTNIFEQASRTKLRITIPQGRGFVQGNVEDLWDLPVRKLKVRAETLYQELRNSDDTLYGQAKVDPEKKLTLDILKHIIAVKEEEIEKVQKKDLIAEKKRKLMEQIAIKESEEQAGKTKEELLKELEELDS